MTTMAFGLGKPSPGQKRIYYIELMLKVGSFPNDDNFVLIFFVLFCIVIKYFYFLNAFLPRKPQDFVENFIFFRLFISLVLEFRF